MTQNETNEVKLPETAEVGDSTSKVGDPIQAERTRVAVLLLTEAPHMAAKYKALISHTGSLLTESMSYAYHKGINDAVKLILKEDNKNGQD